MGHQLPEYLKQGDPARLFPVLAVTSKEGRTASILLACLTCIEELAALLLKSVGRSVGKRAQVEAYTEVVFPNMPDMRMDRPDGLIVVRVGGKEWRGLVEAKVGNAELNAGQIEKYREIAKMNGLDCVITISNHFTSAPANHPLEEVRKSRSKIPVFHWSWMYVLTTADLLVSNENVADRDQLVLLNELRRFLSHESAGVRGFDRMPPAWSELNKLVSNGGAIPAKSPDAVEVVEAWHQETKDLSLILSRLTETPVSERIPRKHQSDPVGRNRDTLQQLRDTALLAAAFDIPDAAAPLNVVADIRRRTVEVGMSLRAPEDKKSSAARVNWLLRQIRDEDPTEVFIRLNWPGSSEATHFSVQELRLHPNIVNEGKEHLQVTSFEVFLSRRLGGRFTQVVNFITDLEQIVPEFYRRVGSGLSAWKRKAPQIRERVDTSEVTVEAISQESDAFE